MSVVIWHNPRCSKSRQTLQLLLERGLEPEVVRYLDDPPGAETLRWVIERLGIPARQLMRRNEAIYKELGLGDESLSDDTLIGAMLEHPRLIERPIVIAGDRVALGRPPERVLALLE